MARLTTLKPRVAPLQATRAGWAQTTVDTTTGRGYGAPWQRLRLQILKRDCGLCLPCQRAGRVRLATAVDHITPKSQGGTDDERNLQSICDPCHKAKTARESGPARR